MPHREPNKFVDGSVYAETQEDGKVMVMLNADHPQFPNAPVGEILKACSNHYSVYTYKRVKDAYGLVEVGEFGIHLGFFTSIDCAIACLEYRNGRLATKRERHFACPDCGAVVMTVMQTGLSYQIPIPRLVNTESVEVYTDTYNNGKYSKVSGYTIHECEVKS